ncbi:hypothetical protein V6N13_133109 [Hibiscus sabdariffa]
MIRFISVISQDLVAVQWEFYLSTNNYVSLQLFLSIKLAKGFNIVQNLNAGQKNYRLIVSLMLPGNDSYMIILQRVGATLEHRVSLLLLGTSTFDVSKQIPLATDLIKEYVRFDS